MVLHCGDDGIQCMTSKEVDGCPAFVPARLPRSACGCQASNHFEGIQFRKYRERSMRLGLVPERRGGDIVLQR